MLIDNPFAVLQRDITRLENKQDEILQLLRSKHPTPPTLPAASPYIDFGGLCREYYPGIPEGTVRQKIATLPRNRREGKRVLFLRSQVEQHLQNGTAQ